MNNRILRSLRLWTLAIMLLCFTLPIQAQAQRNQSRKPDRVKVINRSTSVNKDGARGSKVAALPQNTKVLTHRNVNYHYRNGVYYRPTNGTYLVVNPPLGVRITSLPANLPYLRRGNNRYYLYQGVYYLPVGNDVYEVVDAPVGAIIDRLPDDYETVELDGKVYYRLNETYYKAVLEANGNVVYEVIRV